MMSMKFEKWWWPVQCYTLSNGLNFAGLCTSRIFIFCLGMMLVEILRWMRNSTTTISTVSHYKFHQGNHGSSILYLLLFQKIKLWVVGFFFSFRAILNCLNRGRLIKNWKRKKEIICSGTYLSRCSFFLIAAFFSLSCRVLVAHDRTVKDPR